MPRPRLTFDQAELRGATKVNKGRFNSRSSAPKTDGDVGDPPQYLSPTEKGIWRELIDAIPCGVAGRSDRFVIELAARLLNQYRTDPLMQASRIALLMNALSRLGLDPQARTRLQIETRREQSKDTLTRYLDAIPNAARDPIQ